MFLEPPRLIRRARQHQDAGERGSALILVVILLVVLTAIGLLVAAISMHAIGTTTATRAGMQSQAAADAGIDYAASQIGILHDCDVLYSQDTGAVKFDVEAYYSLSDSGDSWVPCPIAAAEAKRVKLVSTGYAGSDGILDRSSGDVTRVEAIFAFHAPDPIPASGSALYSYESPVFNNAEVTTETGEPANVVYYQGNFECTGTGSHVEGNVLVGAGNGTMDTGCEVDGDLWVSGRVSINNGTVHGNVLAAAPGNSHYFAPHQATVDGYIDLAGEVSSAGSCGAGQLDCFKSELESNVAGGSVTFNDVSVHPPVVTQWIDYGFASLDDQNRWTTDAGFTIEPWNKAEWGCNVDNTVVAKPSFVSDVINVNRNTVFDVRACDGFIFASVPLDWEMKASVAFIVNGDVNIQNLRVSEHPTADEPRLWFITPDEVDDDQPTCLGGKTWVQNSVEIADPVSALIYTPCSARNFTNEWRGQFYGGQVQLDGASRLGYVPVGLAGVDLGTGEEGGSKGSLGGLLTNRNITG